MRILYVNDYYRAGGAEEIMWSLAKAMKATGHEVFLATPNGVQQRDAYSLSRIPQKVALPLRHTLLFNNDPIAFRSISKIIELTRPDILHCHNLWLASLAPILSATPRGVPTVVTVHDYWPVCLNRALIQNGSLCQHCNWKGGLPGCRFRWYDAVFRPFIQRGMTARRAILSSKAVTLVAVSGYVKSVLERFGYRDAPIRVIHNGVESSQFTPSDEGKKECTALFLGGLNPVKGFSDFHAAANIVKQNMPNARFIAIGIGSDRSDSALEVSDRIPRTRQIKLYQNASCVVVPSIWPEPFPTVALESLACGTPVVAYCVGGIPEIIDDQETGLLVARGDIRGLAQRIEYLLGNPDIAHDMGAKGRLKVEASFSLDRMASDYESLYDRISF